ncbi:ABC transporter permease [Dysgonomonas sp. 511]|nr:ABC transporter permease [Dysgonomonas sp. 511]NDV78812.1 ABC transporter permease [Dysgonomonas sp. 511]
MEIEKEHWDIVIKPRGSNFSLNIKEVWKYRDLVRMYIHRDIVTQYKQTILGPFWYVIQALFTTILYMFVFGGIAQISTDGLPQVLFYLSGIVCWNYFLECLNKGSGTFSSNASVFSKVYFPRLVVPISGAISGLLKFFIQFTLFFIAYLYYCFFTDAAITPNAYILLFPLLIFLLAGFGIGFGMIVSSMTTKYRDLAILFTFISSLWMYITPVIYPLSVMEQNYADYMWIIQLNPLTSIIEVMRYGWMGVGTFTWLSFTYSIVVTLFSMIFGIWIFNKVERSFIDVV